MFRIELLEMVEEALKLPLKSLARCPGSYVFRDGNHPGDSSTGSASDVDRFPSSIQLAASLCAVQRGTTVGCPDSGKSQQQSNDRLASPALTHGAS